MRKVFGIFIIALLCVLIGALACKKNEYKNLDCGSINASYKNDIKPIIQGNCTSAGCHEAGSLNGDFTIYQGLKGKADNGSLNKRVLEKMNMPTNGALSLNDRKKLKCWLNNSAPDN